MALDLAQEDLARVESKLSCGSVLNPTKLLHLIQLQNKPLFKEHRLENILKSTVDEAEPLPMRATVVSPDPIFRLSGGGHFEM